jgi:CRP/FNR family transcriptional regulator, dissimilatory nitrate respiration regulator
MLDQLSEALQASITWRTVSQGQTIFRAGEPADLLFFLVSGQVRLVQYTPTGKNIQHYEIEAGEFFAEVVLFVEAYVCNAIANQPSRIASIPKPLFLDELRQNSDLAMVFMIQMARRLHLTKIMLELRSIRSAYERVLRYFQIMIPLIGDPAQSSLELERPFSAIAADLDITPEVLSRTLRQLQDEGRIDRVNRRITLRE